MSLLFPEPGADWQPSASRRWTAGVAGLAALALVLGVALAAGGWSMLARPWGGGVQASPANPPRVLRVCADPNDLPFSNEAREGFENKLAELVARELGAKLEYTWRATRRGYIRETLKAGTADLVLSVPAHLDQVLTTIPYYRSSYAFVTRRGRSLVLRSFDDPALRTLRIGVPLVPGAPTPPAYALAQHDLAANARGYSVYADYARPNPTARIVDAVAEGEVDVAVVWGPLAGYFADREKVPMEVTPLGEAREGPVPLAFSICMGVRKQDLTLRDELNAILLRKHKEIDGILDAYHVPRLALEPAHQSARENAEAPPTDDDCHCHGPPQAATRPTASEGHP